MLLCVNNNVIDLLLCVNNNVIFCYFCYCNIAKLRNCATKATQIKQNQLATQAQHDQKLLGSWLFRCSTMRVHTCNNFRLGRPFRPIFEKSCEIFRTLTDKADEVGPQSAL